MSLEGAVSRVKLIAEPWDTGPNGFQLGKFPPPWAEWNGRYQDAVRRFWRGDDNQAAELARRLSGSSDLFGQDGRGPWASVNYVTTHDGFTLEDVVSYEHKHNDANGEDNGDGRADEPSWNHEVEGPTEDPAIEGLRQKQKRNLLATLLLSQGVPMILGGDESGRTQLGNNNAYCQDNEISWLDWDWSDDDRALFEFTCRLLALRKELGVLRRPEFLQGRLGPGPRDSRWVKPTGRSLSVRDWHAPGLRSLGLLLNDEASASRGKRGGLVRAAVLLAVNGHSEPVDFRLPGARRNPSWQVIVDTERPHQGPGPEYPAQSVFALAARSLVLLRRRSKG